MMSDYVLPCGGDWTVDDLDVLPFEFRYELIDGWLDLPQRGNLSQLGGAALLGSLKERQPEGYRLVPRMPLWSDEEDVPWPDIVVLGPGGDGDVVLVVDVVDPYLLFADMLDRVARLSAMGVPAYWVFEDGSESCLGGGLSEFRRAVGSGFETVTRTREVFTTEVPYPVTVDLPAISNWWPMVFTYRGNYWDREENQ
ncbi:Uma2 family endonuclease [Actinoplanes subtropicus]|uniref:Uma2 family endonuclease n=1 Tax=Actinoplanes subtropicus TaxID=543632 RepID=UPI0004C2BADA|nr:Uma2 family endonuclease [Actinoplanes subtropicus]